MSGARECVCWARAPAEEAEASISPHPNPSLLLHTLQHAVFLWGKPPPSWVKFFVTDWCSLLLFIFFLVVVLSSPPSRPPSLFHVAPPSFISSTCSTPRLLEHQLQTQKRSYDVEVEALRGELQSVKEENNRQQQLLAQNLQLPPEARIEASLQHEITRLTNENLVGRCTHTDTEHTGLAYLLV